MGRRPQHDGVDGFLWRHVVPNFTFLGWPKLGRLPSWLTHEKNDGGEAALLQQCHQHHLRLSTCMWPTFRQPSRPHRPRRPRHLATVEHLHWFRRVHAWKPCGTFWAIMTQGVPSSVAPVCTFLLKPFIICVCLFVYVYMHVCVSIHVYT